MKRKFYLVLLVAVSLLATTMFSSCSDDDDDNNVTNEITEDYKISDVIGKWASSAYSVDVYIELKEDGTGEMADPAEDKYNITWIFDTIELDSVNTSTGNLVEYKEKGIVATDDEGYYYEFQIIGENGTVTALVDFDNNISYSKTTTIDDDDDDDDDELPTIENITIEEDDHMGFNFSWTAFDGASGYFIYINGESISDVQICSNPYTANVEIEKHDTIKVEAWSQLKEEVIASGSIIYKEDEPSKINDLTSEVGDSHVSFSWTEPNCKFSEVLIFYYEGLYTSGNHFDTIRVAKGTTTYDITGLNNLDHYTFNFFTYNGESNKKSEAAYASDLMPFPENSINLSDTYWKNEDGTKSLDFDYRSDFSASFRSVGEYTDGDFSKRLSYYFDFSSNSGTMKNWDWNGWETSSEYFALTYNNETETLTFADVDYTLVEE